MDARLVKDFASEVADGERFAFGGNWARFLHHINDDRITEATRAIRKALGVGTLSGKCVLDIGSGSGLSSLAFRRLGATVTSFDIDPQSVACTQELKRREGASDSEWRVSSGSVLDGDFVRSLGRFDIVYSWGVLHHTGQMWRAMENALEAVEPGGKICIAVYNDQGVWSRCWLSVKKAYNRLPRELRWLVLLPVLIEQWGPRCTIDLFRGHPFERWLTYAKHRGMSPWHDVIDWAGGLPFEVATPEAVFQFFNSRNCQLFHLKTCAGRIGCNEYTFVRAGG